MRGYRREFRGLSRDAKLRNGSRLFRLDTIPSFETHARFGRVIFKQPSPQVFT
jgi:hypothetical protein